MEQRADRNKYDRIISRLILISGSFALVCYVSYLIKLFIYPEGALPYIACILVICGVVLPIAFDKPLRNLTKKAYPVLKSIYCVVLCLYMVSFAVLYVFIYSGTSTGPSPENLPEKTVFVVFGAKVQKNSVPGKALKRRLDKAYELMAVSTESLCIVTGGKGNDEPRAEADVMYDYLVEKGISPERIIVEDKATDTLENIQYSRELISENSLDDYVVACVSTGFHIPRIMYISEKTGFDADYFYRAPGSNLYIEFTSVVREYMSYAKLFIMGY